MTEVKTPQQSLAITSIIVMPNDTNTLGNLMGGNLLKWMDVNAAIAAHRHCKRVVVTAAVNNVSFDQPVKLGDLVLMESKVTRTFKSSMEVYTDVWVEDHVSGEKTKCNESIYTFVAVDQRGGPIAVPQIKPESEEEVKRYGGALRRRQLSLILAGKMSPDEATELKALFEH